MFSTAVAQSTSLATAGSRIFTDNLARSSNLPELPERLYCREMADQLILKRVSASRSSGEWKDDDYDVLADSVVVGRIFNAAASPVGMPWLWTLAFGHHEDRTPPHGYAASRARGGDDRVREKLAAGVKRLKAQERI
jgi:hypothetical protein